MSHCVLIVEDDADLRRLYAVGLSHRGYKVRLAANGQDAIERVEVERPDVIVLDIIMPVMDGWEVIERINTAGKSAIPVIVLSGTPRPNDDEFPSSLCDWVQKPTSLDELGSAIERCVGENSG